MYILGKKLHFVDYDVDMVGTEAVVFVPSCNKVVVLNQTALAILTTTKSIAETSDQITEDMICDEMMDMYNYVNLERSELKTDIKTVIDSFVTIGLLEQDR